MLATAGVRNVLGEWEINPWLIFRIQLGLQPQGALRFVVVYVVYNFECVFDSSAPFLALQHPNTSLVHRCTLHSSFPVKLVSSKFRIVFETVDNWLENYSPYLVGMNCWGGNSIHHFLRQGSRVSPAPSPMVTPSHLAQPPSPSTSTLGGRRVRNVTLRWWGVKRRGVEKEGEDSRLIFREEENWTE